MDNKKEKTEKPRYTKPRIKTDPARDRYALLNGSQPLCNQQVDVCERET